MNAPVISKAEQRKLLRARLKPIKPLPTGLKPRLPKLNGIRAVLFDVYGTILVARQGEVGAHSPTPAKAALAALRAAGFKQLSPDLGPQTARLLAQTIAADHTNKKKAGVFYPEVDIREIWLKVLKKLIRKKALTGTCTSQALEQLAMEYECRTNPVWPMPGLNRTLQTLAQAGMKIALVSNAQFYTPLLLDALPGTGWQQARFDPDLAAWSWQLAEAKPSKRLVQHSLRALRKRHGINPEQTIMIGNDMLNDMLPAAQTGCKTALFAGDARSLRLRQNLPECAKLEPDLILTRLDQLPKTLVHE